MKILSIITGLFLLASSTFSKPDDSLALEASSLASSVPVSAKQRVQITDAQLLQLSSDFAAEMPPIPDDLYPYIFYYAIEASYPGILDPARLGIQVEPVTAVDSNTISPNMTLQALSETDPGPPVPPGAGGGTSTNSNPSTPLPGLKLAIDPATNGLNQLRVLEYTNGVPYDIFWTAEIGPNAVWTLWRQNELNRTILFPQPMTGSGFFLLATIYDADLDGLTDAYETLVSKTNPNSSDSDQDGVGDGVEIQLGMDPLNGNDKFQIWVSQPGASQLP